MTDTTTTSIDQLLGMIDNCSRMVDELPSRADFDALLDLARQYRNDMQFPDLDAGQRQRRIEAIDAALAKAEGRS